MESDIYQNIKYIQDLRTENLEFGKKLTIANEDKLILEKKI